MWHNEVHSLLHGNLNKKTTCWLSRPGVGHLTRWRSGRIQACATEATTRDQRARTPGPIPNWSGPWTQALDPCQPGRPADMDMGVLEVHHSTHVQAKLQLQPAGLIPHNTYHISQPSMHPFWPETYSPYHARQPGVQPCWRKPT
eukprot:363330-Chlamydomonas_euryale.AAC.4